MQNGLKQAEFYHELHQFLMKFTSNLFHKIDDFGRKFNVHLQIKRMNYGHA